MLNILLGLLPILLLLAGLVMMDSFKLLRPLTLAAALAWGGLVAMGNHPVHGWLLDGGMTLSTLTRYVAPVLEEVGKIGFVVLLCKDTRVPRSAWILRSDAIGSQPV